MNDTQSYTNRDYSSIRKELIDKIPELTKNWTDFNESDTGMTLLELLAYSSDSVNYMLDRQALETYLDTAVQDKNIRNHLRVMNYRLPLLGGAKGVVTVTFSQETTRSTYIPKYTRLQSTFKNVNYLVSQDTAIPKGSIEVNVPVFQGDYREKSFTSAEMRNKRKFYLDSDSVADGSITIVQTNVIWEEVDDALMQYQGGYYFSVHTDSEGKAYILFAPDCASRFPKDSAEKVIVKYADTIGTSGVVDAGDIDMIFGTLSVGVTEVGNTITVSRVHNDEGTYGAWDAVNLNNAKLYARRQAQMMDRYITLADYKSAVESEPFIMHCVVADWKSEPNLVEQPYLVRVWAVDYTGKFIGYQDRETLRRDLENKGVNTIKVEIVTPKFIETDIKVVLTVKSQSQSVKDSLRTLVEGNLEEMYNMKNLSFGQSFLVSRITSDILAMSDFITDVSLESPEENIRLNTTEFPVIRTISVEVL